MNKDAKNDNNADMIRLEEITSTMTAVSWIPSDANK